MSRTDQNTEDPTPMSSAHKKVCENNRCGSCPIMLTCQSGSAYPGDKWRMRVNAAAEVIIKKGARNE